MELAGLQRPSNAVAMEKNDGCYTAADAATANSVLRAAAGLAAEKFGTEQFVRMISDEIELLRRAGKTDAEIAQLLADGGGIELNPDAITRFYASEAARRPPV